eukprot:2821060-Rhodomonas_salina.1
MIRGGASVLTLALQTLDPGPPGPENPGRECLDPQARPQVVNPGPSPSRALLVEPLLLSVRIEGLRLPLHERYPVSSCFPPLSLSHSSLSDPL